MNSTCDMCKTCKLQVLKVGRFSVGWVILAASASPAASVVDVAACRTSVASQDIFGGRISPNINVATPNLVSLRRQGCGLGLETVSRRTNVPSRSRLEKNCQRLGLGRQTSRSLLFTFRAQDQFTA